MPYVVPAFITWFVCLSWFWYSLTYLNRAFHMFYIGGLIYIVCEGSIFVGQFNCGWIGKMFYCICALQVWLASMQLSPKLKLNGISLCGITTFALTSSTYCLKYKWNENDWAPWSFSRFSFINHWLLVHQFQFNIWTEKQSYLKSKIKLLEFAASVYYLNKSRHVQHC